MRLFHVVPTYLPATRYGGPIYSVHGLCRALAARGHDVEVFTTNVDGSGTSDVPVRTPVDVDGVQVTYFSSSFDRLYWSPGMRSALDAKMRDVDLVHTHSVFLWPTAAAARAARRADVALVISPRGMLVRDLISRRNAVVKKAWLATVERRNFASARAIHFTSQREWDDAAELNLPLPSPFVAPNGVDVMPPLDVVRDPRAVLFLGRISWKKGLPRLIEALRYAPDAKLIVAGNDDEHLTPRLQSDAATLGVADRIEWHGEVHGDAKRRLYASSSIFALTSDSENFGNTVLEAMAESTPVLVTPGVGLAESVRSAGAGAVVEPSPEVIGAAIGDLLARPDALRTMGERGRALVEHEFSWPRIAATMEQHYATVLERQRMGAP